MKKAHKHKYAAFLSVILALLIVIVSGAFFLLFFHFPDKTQTPEKTPTNLKTTIYPTLYISGSSGNNVPNNYMVSHLAAAPGMTAEVGLTFQYDNGKGQLKVTGEISPDNTEPMISVAVAMFGIFGHYNGTSNGKTYVPAIRKVIEYLQERYNVPWVNLEGYSSGATGALYYMADYGQSKTLPRVNKFLSLNGEFNAKTPLQQGETLEDVLKRGPTLKTPMYQYIEMNFSKVDKRTKVLLLDGGYDAAKQWDSTLPWADSFAVYSLFAEHGNPVSHKLYPTTLKHGGDFKETAALEEIKNFFYSDEKLIGGE